MTTPPRLLYLLALPVIVLGCDPEPTADAIPTLDVDARGALVQCEHGAYDLDRMDAKLRASAELASELGLSRVSNCDDAEIYLAGVDDYIESFPSEPLAEDDVFRIANAEESNLSRNGVLRVGGCTGVLIHERALITAAHCVADLAPSSGEKNFWVSNLDIANFGGGTFSDTVRVNVHPDYTGESDSGDDIAVVKLTSGSFPFPDEDRHRMYTGPMSTIGTMRLFGQGFSSNTDTNLGTLRKMVFLPDWSGPEHFLMDAQTSRTCNGDSGGPVMDLLPDGVTRVVAGLHVSSEKWAGDVCARSGGKQRSVRLQNKIRWIDEMIGGTDSDDCHPLEMDGWLYERCW